ncbi:MAG: hypothetical protein ACRDSZ_06900 [Pseudonocardiaceae bacterium]
MSRRPIQPTLPMPTFDGTGGQAPLLLVDGHNLLWGATFGFPAPIYSRDKSRLLTGLFAFFALLRVAIRDDVPGAAPEVIPVRRQAGPGPVRHSGPIIGRWRGMLPTRSPGCTASARRRRRRCFTAA